MKKLSILFFAIALVIKTNAQLLAILQFPPSGFTYKPQLWNIVLTNTTNASISLHIEVTLTPVNSSSSVFSGVSRAFSIQPGTTLINANTLTPIQYNVLSSAYVVDANPIGLLPIGRFEACYHFFKHTPENVSEVVEQCQDITVGPLSPPQLVYPFDQTSIEEENPQFTWLPPVPANLFTSLKYDLDLVEINSGQSAADAIEQNVPIYQGTNISPTTLLYPLNATALQYGKEYAWRVTAKNNGAEVGTTETWQFNLKHFNAIQFTAPMEQPFVELKKNPETAYAVFVNDIKFSYLNETSDTTWKLKVYDLSSNRSEGDMSFDTIPLKKGQNLVKYNAKENSFFADRHLYQLEVTNTRNEIWRMRFEYRKAENDNQ